MKNVLIIDKSISATDLLTNISYFPLLFYADFHFKVKFFSLSCYTPADL